MFLHFSFSQVPETEESRAAVIHWSRNQTTEQFYVCLPSLATRLTLQLHDILSFKATGSSVGPGAARTGNCRLLTLLWVRCGIVELPPRSHGKLQQLQHPRKTWWAEIHLQTEEAQIRGNHRKPTFCPCSSMMARAGKMGQHVNTLASDLSSIPGAHVKDRLHMSQCRLCPS